MVYTYASSYISGFGKTIEAILKSKVKDVIIIKHLDGLVIYQTKLEFSQLRLPCFNNTYQVLAMADAKSNIPYDVAVKRFIANVDVQLTGLQSNINTLKNKSFKILPFDGNLPTSINFDVIKSLENKVERTLNLKVGFRRHDFDLVLLRRREGLFLALFKLTYNRLTEKDLNKGALRPELCYILSWISDLNKNDIIIDPFCGYGSIPKIIVKYFTYNMLFASDIDEILINKLKKEFKKNKKNLFIKRRDALNLAYFENDFFDKIITDPPWNLYNFQNEDFSLFYKKMFDEFYRVLKPNGICTILMGNRVEFERALNTRSFKTLETYHILVNGKKATVYKLMKIQ